MSESLQLDAFLDDQADDGASLGEAEFTVDRAEALKKLAQHSLPFPGAWLLKAVQTAVSSGCERGITVTSTRTETEVRFDSKRVWNRHEVATAFLDPDPCEDAVLGHLKFAMWGAGISAKHPFELRLPGEEAALLWSGGETLAEVPLESPSEDLVLTVPHQVLGEPPLGFFARRKHASNVNATTIGALSNNAYTCPLPLTLDGRRLDSLLLAPIYFHGNVAQPVELGFIDHPSCPTWGIPMGTFDAFRKRPYDYKPGAIDRLAVDAVQAAEQVGSASIAYLYVAHLGMRTIGKTVTWQYDSQKSNLYWVQDGVLVRHEVFPMEPTTLSVTCYVSAQGLNTDLTTLQLVASDAKGERTADVIRAMSYDILKPRHFGFDNIRSNAKRDDRIAAGALGVFGTLMLPALPIGLLMLWASHRTLKDAGDKVESIVKHVEAGYPLLQKRWQTDHADYLPREGSAPC